MLDAAAEWGKPPWEIAGENGGQANRLKWFIRWQEYGRQKAKAQTDG